MAVAVGMFDVGAVQATHGACRLGTGWRVRFRCPCVLEFVPDGPTFTRPCDAHGRGPIDWYAETDRVCVPHIPAASPKRVPEREVGPRRLLTALLIDALDCIARPAQGRDFGGRNRLRAEALAWVKSTDRSDLCTFSCVCEALGFDERPVRAFALELVDRPEMLPPIYDGKYSLSHGAFVGAIDGWLAERRLAS